MFLFFSLYNKYSFDNNTDDSADIDWNDILAF